MTVGTQIGVTVQLLDWAVKSDIKRDISTTEINLSARQSLHFELQTKSHLRAIIKNAKEIPIVGDNCLRDGLEPNIIDQLRSGRSPFSKTVPRTLINSDTFTVKFSCPTIKSLHNLRKLAEDGDLSDIMKSLTFGHMTDQLPLESLSVESTIDGDKYRKLQKTLQGHSTGADTTKSTQCRYMKWKHCYFLVNLN